MKKNIERKMSMLVMGELNKLEKVLTMGGFIEYRGEVSIDEFVKYSFVEFVCKDDKIFGKLVSCFGTCCVIKLKRNIDLDDNCRYPSILEDIKIPSKIDIFEYNVFNNMEKSSSTTMTIT